MKDKLQNPLTEETAIKLISLIEEHNRDLSQRHREVYDNHSLMDLLGIKEKYIKRLRDNGLLGYSRHGDKYWYTRKDVDAFLQSVHYEAFAQEKGGVS